MNKKCEKMFKHINNAYIYKNTLSHTLERRGKTFCFELVHDFATSGRLFSKHNTRKLNSKKKT